MVTKKVPPKPKAAPFDSAAREAYDMVHGPRGQDYGHPIHDFERTAGMMNALFKDRLRKNFTPEDIPLIMVMVKMSREFNHPKRDNRVDIAGYAETLEMVHDYKARK